MEKQAREAMRLKYEVCQGEFVCTTDKDSGRIAKENDELGEDPEDCDLLTLENYCKESLCPLYQTKPENYPEELQDSYFLGIELRNFRNSGILDVWGELSFYDVTCLMGVDSGWSRAESSKAKEDEESKT